MVLQTFDPPKHKPATIGIIPKRGFDKGFLQIKYATQEHSTAKTNATMKNAIFSPAIREDCWTFCISPKPPDASIAIYM